MNRRSFFKTLLTPVAAVAGLPVIERLLDRQRRPWRLVKGDQVYAGKPRPAVNPPTRQFSEFTDIRLIGLTEEHDPIWHECPYVPPGQLCGFKRQNLDAAWRG